MIYYCRYRLKAGRWFSAGPERGRAIPTGARAADQHGAGGRCSRYERSETARRYIPGRPGQAQELAERMAPADEPGLRAERRRWRCQWRTTVGGG